MIAFVKGKVASYGADWVVVDCHDIGYQMAYPHPENLHLNDEVFIYTYLHITENDMSLFGFESQDEKALFLKLISVKGLGPKTAMSMLSKCGYQSIVSAIESGDVTLLKKMPGIGEKSASQIVLDLKGKLVAVPTSSPKQDTVSYPAEIREALEGLKNLGYKQGELSAVANMMSENPGLTTEKYLKLGLQFLVKQK